jgi:two-component system LytT family sensor kinase
VTNDLNFLTGVATQCGNRFDALRVERETIERRSREAGAAPTGRRGRTAGAALADQSAFPVQFAEHDRRPDRAQSAAAEEMTLRLASVFRHVLANSSRALVSVRDEIDFVRTYLHIEEARFGDRLQVEITVDPEVADEQVPSLILQPLVENALKHGLAPKPGPGHLWISVHAEGDQFRVTIADDGMGLNEPNEGLGLKNVADRLRTLYQDRAERDDGSA